MLPATNMTNHAVLERGLQTELTGHLGYAKGDPENRLLPNSRNGFTETTVSNEIGDVTLAIPRPRWRSAPSPRSRLASTSAASNGKGFTWETKAHLYFRRFWSSAALRCDGLTRPR
ncbi:MAG: putative transposase [Mycobacterium sp.]|jgi:hypothetical protein|nr:putative transposase [Mycobacterium sp.]MDT5199891.1 putative transposase [Mycobacterium sp.]MDT5342224.1 putative transposase [Mycobacterium sp.]